MINNNYKLIDFKRLLRANGYYESSKEGKGSHVIYTNGTNRISVPRMHKEVRGTIARKIIKTYKLTEVF